MTSRTPPLTILKDSAQLAEKILGDRLDFPIDYDFDVDEIPRELVMEIGESNRLHGRMKLAETDEGQQWAWKVCASVATEGGPNVPSSTFASGRSHRPYSALADMAGALLKNEVEVQADEIQSTHPSFRIAEVD